MTFDLAIEAASRNLPPGWRVEPFRRHASLVAETNHAKTGPLLSLASNGCVSPRTEDGGLGRQAPSDSTIERGWVAKPGDLVVNPMWLIGGGIGVSNVTGAVSPDYRVYRLGPDLHPRFVHYLLRSGPYRDQYRLYTRADTTFDRRVSKENFHPMPLILPPLEEQRRIADFLDAETAHIDRICAMRERQVELLAEATFRRVFDAVRGAHVSGERKPSGLAWLETVPVHWRVAAVSHHFEVELGKMLNQERAQGEHLRPYLRVANVQWDSIDVSNLALMDFPPSERERYRLKPGDLLVNEGGSWPGRAAVWDGRIEEIYYQKALHRIRSRGAEVSRWLYYCLALAERLRVFQAQGNSSTMTHLTREQLRPQRFPFPSIREQHELVADLDEATSMERMTRSKLTRQVELLSERRAALITAAVTGELDIDSANGRSGGIAL